MEYETSYRTERYLLPIAQRITFLAPTLEEDLRYADMDVRPIRYLGFCLKNSLIIGLSTVFSLVIAGIIVGERSLQILGLSTVLLIPLIFLSLAYRPRVKAERRSRAIDRELPYALRHILIQIKSEISLYNAMVSVTEDYGEASEEFQKIVDEVNGGKSQIEALEESVRRNKSLKYRKTLWQMINSLKSGAEMGDTLQTLVDNMLEEQRLEVEKYGEDLNPFILVYLMIGVILPSLGITVMIVLSSFTEINIGATVFSIVIFGLLMFNLAFLNLIKTKRPDVKAA